MTEMTEKRRKSMSLLSRFYVENLCICLFVNYRIIFLRICRSCLSAEF